MAFYGVLTFWRFRDFLMYQRDWINYTFHQVVLSPDLIAFIVLCCQGNNLCNLEAICRKEKILDMMADWSSSGPHGAQWQQNMIEQLLWLSDTCISVADLQLNIFDFPADRAAKQQLTELGLPYCCGPVVQAKFPHLLQHNRSRLATSFLVLFGNSHLCESLLSKLFHKKDKYRSCLTEEP